MEKNAQLLPKLEKIKKISKKGKDTVYCMKVTNNSNFIANGIVVANCDALRYACFSAFPQGEFNSPDENLSIDQLRRKIYQENEGYGFMDPGIGAGYF